MINAPGSPRRKSHTPTHATLERNSTIQDSVCLDWRNHALIAGESEHHEGVLRRRMRT